MTTGLNILKIKTQVSTGTYIRTLAHDIGEKLGCGAYCEELERTKIGKYKVKKAVGPKELNTKKLPFIHIQSTLLYKITAIDKPRAFCYTENVI